MGNSPEAPGSFGAFQTFLKDRVAKPLMETMRPPSQETSQLQDTGTRIMGTVTPPYMKQDNNPTVPGAISNMVKAIMAGNNQYLQHQKPAGTGSPAPAPAVGAPLSLAPDNPGASAPPTPTPTPMPRPAVASPPASGATGAPPMSGTPTELSQAQAAAPFEHGAGPMPFAPAPGMISDNGNGSSTPGMPNGIGPTMSALFSHIPGMDGNPFGGGTMGGFPNVSGY